MKRAAWTVVAAALLAAPLAAQKNGADCALDVGFPPPGGVVEFRVGGPETGFFGAVLVALQPDLRHYLQLLPPTLHDFVVLGVGHAEGKYVVTVPEGNVPPGVFLYAQGLVLWGKDAAPDRLCATDVKEFVVDGAGGK